MRIKTYFTIVFQVVGGGGVMRGGRRGEMSDSVEMGRGCEATGRYGERLSHGASRGFP